MNVPVSKYWRLRLQHVQGRLIGNNFGAMVAEIKSSGRICNVRTVSEKSYPKNRVIVVLINAELGL